MSDIKMIDSEDKIKEIFRRVEIAANGQISTASWCEADVNLSAPDGMDYWEWIEQAVNDSICANSVLAAQNLALKAALETLIGRTQKVGGFPCGYLDDAYKALEVGDE